MNKYPEYGAALDFLMHGAAVNGVMSLAEIFDCGTLYINGKYVAGTKKACNEIKQLRKQLASECNIVSLSRQ